MALKDLSFESVTIKAGKGEFAVRGLSFADITSVFTFYKEDAKEALALFEEKTGGDSEKLGEVLPSLLPELLSKLPTLTAFIIALAADEPEMIGTVSKLPAPVQLESLITIGRLTFEEPEALKNFFVNLTDLLGGLTKAMNSATANPALAMGGSKRSAKR